MSEKRGAYRFGAVIPAAGLSSRMGAFKPLLPLGDSTVIERTVSAVLPYAAEIAVVLGNRADEVKEVLTKRFGNRVKIVINHEYRATDMLCSVQLGLRKLGRCDGFFLLPGDMPLIGDGVFAALGDAFDQECRVIYPTCSGRRGHPPLIPATLIPAILAYRGDGGLKAILRQASVREVTCGDPAILFDLDTPGDYQSIQSRRDGEP
ncbi:NTP transferase domain-containing protein [Ruminococcus sp.]|uniref:nucleotidyltransferase family protein n=1 Tax=Ruminococcus sp. TaxID=41978 RepID=UPI00388E7DFF